MVTAVIVLHIVVCISLVIVVLLQQGKGADVGAVFGGSSQTVFGAGGASSPLFKLTWTFAALFAFTSLFLAYSSTKRISGSIFEGRRIPVPIAVPATVPLSGVPAAPASTIPKAPPSNPAAPASNPAAPAPPK
jgi:preprotein translocase subunit SecG